jgi:hypothetical protein
VVVERIRPLVLRATAQRSLPSRDFR